MNGTFTCKNLDLDQIFESGQCFRWEKRGSGYVIPINERRVYIQPTSESDTFNVEGDCTLAEVGEYFDWMQDYSHIIRQFGDEEDVYMRLAMSLFSGIRILRQPLWETLVTFVISQNNSMKRIRGSVQSLVNQFGGVFPNEKQIITADLDGAGVGYRAKYLRQVGSQLRQALDLAMLEGAISEEQLENLNYGHAYRVLLNVPGIGPKVADCTCLFGLHQLQAAPFDRWMQKVVLNRYHGDIPEWMDSPYAGVYQQYAFCLERFLKGQLSSELSTKLINSMTEAQKDDWQFVVNYGAYKKSKIA